MPVISRRELGLFIAVVILWGVNWPMMKMALAELDFWVFRTYCIAAGIVWFVGYNLTAGITLVLPREHWGRMLICALCNVAGWNIFSAAGLALLPLVANSHRLYQPHPLRSIRTSLPAHDA